MIAIFLANGFEEIEAIVPRDLLKRANLDVKMVGVQAKTPESFSGLKINVDLEIDNINENQLKAIILPGGMPGTTNLDKNLKLKEIIKHCFDNEILICAICAAPLIIGKMGLLNGKTACCYPSFEENLKGAKISDESVCVDGKIITAKGPGSAFEFSFAIIEALRCKKEARIIGESIQYQS